MPNLRRVMMGAAGVSAGGSGPYTLFGWGQNTFGRLGLGNTTNYSSPKQVGSDTDWASVTAGYYTNGGVSATKTDGTLWSWGKGKIYGKTAGMLGLNNLTYYSSPVQVGSLTDWRGAIQGYRSTLGFKTDGTLWAWGYGRDGQLAQGNTSSTSSPVQVGSLTNWSTSSFTNAWAGSDSWRVIKPDGTMWTWGDGALGQGGTGNTTDYSSPVQIGGLTTWYRGVAAGSRGNIVTKTDGTIWSWGQNSGGCLGLGLSYPNHVSSPTQIGSLTDWKWTTTDTLPDFSNRPGGFAFVIKNNGTAWAWGGAYDGRLGLGNTTAYSSPVQVGGLTTWNRTGRGGYRHTEGVNTSGQLFVWGKNTDGQLGLGNTTNYSSPVQLGSDTNWISTSGNRNFNMGLKTP